MCTRCAEQAAGSSAAGQTCTPSMHAVHAHGSGATPGWDGTQRDGEGCSTQADPALQLKESMKPLPCVPAPRKASPASITPAAPSSTATCQQQHTSCQLARRPPSPVTLLSVHTCWGIALGCVLQQSRLPQQVWPGLQHDRVAASPHTRPAWQQAWFCSQRQQQVQEEGEEEEQKRKGSVPGCRQHKQMQPCLPA